MSEIEVNDGSAEMNAFPTPVGMHEPGEGCYCEPLEGTMQIDTHIIRFWTHRPLNPQEYQGMPPWAVRALMHLKIQVPKNVE